MSIRAKLFITNVFIIIGLVLLAAGGLSLSKELGVRDTQYNALKTGRVLTSQFKEYIQRAEYDMLTRTLDERGYKLVLLSEKGIVAYSNNIKYKAGDKPSLTLLSPDYKEDNQFVKLVYPIGGQFITHAVYFIPEKELIIKLSSASAVSFIILTAVGFAIILLSFVYIIYIFLRRIIKPAERIFDSVTAIEKGDFSKAVAYGGDDEIARLCEAYEDMRLRIADLNESSHSQQMQYQELIAGISHDLRTPMASILAYSEALMENVAEDEAAKSFYYKVINDKAIQVMNLTKDLLEHSLDSLDRIKIKLSEVYSADLIQSVAKPVFLEAKKAGIHFEMPSRIENRLIVIDTTRMQQVISNIISNALKYTPPGGTISIITDSFDDYYRIQVNNTGPGIDSKDLPYIFDRFYRSQKYEDKKEGVGLGMYIAKVLMDKQGGRIEVTSSYEKGTTFSLYIPLA